MVLGKRYRECEFEDALRGAERFESCPIMPIPSSKSASDVIRSAFFA